MTQARKTQAPALEPKRSLGRQLLQTRVMPVSQAEDLASVVIARIGSSNGIPRGTDVRALPDRFEAYPVVALTAEELAVCLDDSIASNRSEIKQMLREAIPADELARRSPRIGEMMRAVEQSLADPESGVSFRMWFLSREGLLLFVQPSRELLREMGLDTGDLHDYTLQTLRLDDRLTRLLQDVLVPDGKSPANLRQLLSRSRIDLLRSGNLTLADLNTIEGALRLWRLSLADPRFRLFSEGAAVVYWDVRSLARHNSPWDRYLEGPLEELELSPEATDALRAHRITRIEDLDWRSTVDFIRTLGLSLNIAREIEAALNVYAYRHPELAAS